MFNRIFEVLLCARRLKHLKRLDMLPRAGFSIVQDAARTASDLLPVHPATVFDGGFHDGVFSRAVSMIYPNVRVCACDPFDRREHWQFKPERFFNVALGRSPASAEMKLVNDPQLHSLLPFDPTYKKSLGPVFEQIAETKTVAVRPLDALFSEAGWPGCDLLKLDIQGSELSALQGAERVLPYIKGIYLEVSFARIYEGQPVFGEIDEFLSARGFKLAKILNCHGRTYLLQADALFLNTRVFPQY